MGRLRPARQTCPRPRAVLVRASQGEPQALDVDRLVELLSIAMERRARGTVVDLSPDLSVDDDRGGGG